MDSYLLLPMSMALVIQCFIIYFAYKLGFKKGYWAGRVDKNTLFPLLETLTPRKRIKRAGWLNR